jgi:hypothetical protein
MKAGPALVFYRGRTVHQRETPFRRAFSYPVAMIGIDIDHLTRVGRDLRLFSVNAVNALSFHARDHGLRRPGESLRAWAEDRLSEAGVALEGGKVELVTFPRVLGVGFSPISLWLGHGPEGELRGAVYEVHNTFGETHAYVSRIDPGHGRMTADKEFHVSPFFDVSGAYRFTLRKSPSRLELIVENMAPEGRNHIASLLVRPRPASDLAILNWLTALPFSGLGVILAIHWQALILLLRGARYRDKPAQRANQTTCTAPVGEPEQDAAAGMRQT